MGLTSDEFLRRLCSDAVVHCSYQAGDLVGTIAVYPFNRVFVLYWEKCRDGDQRNRDAYLRDEMHRFESPEEVLAFVERAGHPSSTFSPSRHAEPVAAPYRRGMKAFWDS